MLNFIPTAPLFEGTSMDKGEGSHLIFESGELDSYSMGKSTLVSEFYEIQT